MLIMFFFSSHSNVLFISLFPSNGRQAGQVRLRGHVRGPSVRAVHAHVHAGQLYGSGEVLLLRPRKESDVLSISAEWRVV